MISEIPISKGVFKTRNNRSLRNSEFAENLINLFVSEAGGNEDRPTLETFATLSSDKPIGMTHFAGVLVVITDDRMIFTVSPSGVVTNITGVSLPGTARPTFATDGTILVIAGGEEPLKWQGVGFVTSLLGGSPPEMTHIVYLDGYLIANVANDNEVRFSEFDTPETWTGTNVFSNNAEPDKAKSLAVSQRELYVVGEVSTEVWQNVGAFPVPFGRAFIWQYGTPAPYSVIADDNSVFFLNQNRMITRISGRQIASISDPIDSELETYDTVDDCVAFSFPWNGSRHVLFVFPTARKAWSFDLKSGQWTEWRGYNNGWSRARINCGVYAIDDETVYVGDYHDGRIYRFSKTIKTDAGGIFKRARTFSQRDGGAAIRKTASLLRVNLKRDVASFTGTSSQTNPTLELRWKDDNKPWSNFRQVSLGEKGEPNYFVEFRRLGMFRSRQYELQISDPVECNIIGVETDEEAMVS